MDRPFLQHVVEFAVDQGCREIDFLLARSYTDPKKLLGDGKRWGARFRYYSPSEGSHEYTAFETVPWKDPEERILLAHADRLPEADLEKVKSYSALFCWRAGELHWTGWGVIRASDLRCPLERADEEGLFSSLLSANSEAVCLEGAPPLASRSHADLIEANRRVLAKEFPRLLVGGKEVKPGVWMARNVSVHATAKLVAPAFLGENCKVAALVQVGPSATIGRDCMIERKTFVSNSIVCRGSYVGEQLALQGVVVDRSWLVNARFGVTIEGVDELLLGSVFGPPLTAALQRILSRLLAALALVAACPFLLAVTLGSALGAFPKVKREFMVQTPAVSEPYRWRTFAFWSFGSKSLVRDRYSWLRHFFFFFLPGLCQVVKGHVDFVGPRPRTTAEMEVATASERAVYLQSRPGLLQPDLFCRPEQDSNSYGANVFEDGWLQPISTVIRYAGRLLWTCVSAFLPAALAGEQK